MHTQISQGWQRCQDKDIDVLVVLSWEGCAAVLKDVHPYEAGEEVQEGDKWLPE